MRHSKLTSTVNTLSISRHKKGLSPVSYDHQQGVALLTVLLLVVAITVVAGSMMASQRLSLRQYELLVTQDEIVQDIRAAEDLAATLIAADAKVNDSDSLQDAWAQPMITTALGGHDIRLTIKDASARFNVNNLYHDGEVDQQALEVFQRLLSQLGHEPNLAYAVLDWQDADDEAFEQGSSESEVYLNKNSAQSAASTIPNQPFLSVEQLSSVTGFTPEIITSLQPYIIAVPYYLPINVNTAEPMLLSALAKDIQPEQFEPWVTARQTAPTENISDLLQQAPWSSIEAAVQGDSPSLIDSRSHGFYVLIDVVVKKREEEQHRYATTFISKLSTESEGEESSNSGAIFGAGGMNGSDAAAASVTIEPFGTRLWTYRPAF